MLKTLTIGKTKPNFHSSTIFDELANGWTTCCFLAFGMRKCTRICNLTCAWLRSILRWGVMRIDLLPLVFSFPAGRYALNPPCTQRLHALIQGEQARNGRLAREAKGRVLTSITSAPHQTDTNTAPVERLTGSLRIPRHCSLRLSWGFAKSICLLGIQGLHRLSGQAVTWRAQPWMRSV